MKVVQDSLKNDKNFIIASYSVMPDRDSVATLRSYATDNQTIDNKWHYIHQDGQTVYKFAVTRMADVSEELLKRKNG